MKILLKITRTAILPLMLLGIDGCAYFSERIAAKNDSWIGSHWQEYNRASIRGECYQVSPSLVSCYLQDWTVDSNGIITGWRSNNRR